MAQEVHKVAIVGSGPAGYTAALYASRANLTPILFEGLQPGGQLTITTDVENYPGFPQGIMGPELMVKFREQAVRFGTIVHSENVTKVVLNAGRPFTLATPEREIKASTVIIATGASAKLLDLPREAEFMGHGLSACATCDGFFFRGKNVLVVGGGDSAMEEANFLTRFSPEVTIVHRRDEWKASKIMLDRAQKNPKIKFMINTVPVGYVGDPKQGGLTAVRVKDTLTSEERDVKTGGIFLAIGHVPNTQLFEGQLELDKKGYIIAQPGSTKTKIPGVFACGDVQDSYYRQAVTAAGTGCMAAIDAERYLEAEGH